MALALYRKYRPRTFAEVIGQEHVTEPLIQALRSGRLNHAYLFSGPRGCGKTSSARILARSLNCEKGPTPEPCGECESCRALAPDGPGSIDVIEIDAASHGGVDDARELRERAFFAPAVSRFKIYIIDEAHMVSSAGFNALLKLVEEPPDYVKFVFATTEPEKVLGTIKSRTHHYPFRLIPPSVLRPYLEYLCEVEKVTVDPRVFPLVVRAGAGSARDSLSVLDQLMAGAGDDGVTYARAVSLLGVTDAGLIDEMCDALGAGDAGAAFATIDRVAEAGHDPRRFTADLLERLRDLILLRQVPDAIAKGLIDTPADEADRMQAQAQRTGPATLTRWAEIVHGGLVEMRGTTSTRLLLELVTARMLLPAADESELGVLSRLERLEQGVVVRPAGSVGGAAPVATAGAPEHDDDPGSAATGGSGGGRAAARAAAAAAAAPRGSAPKSTPAGNSAATPGTPATAADSADDGAAAGDDPGPPWHDDAPEGGAAATRFDGGSAAPVSATSAPAETRANAPVSAAPARPAETRANAPVSAAPARPNTPVSAAPATSPAATANVGGAANAAGGPVDGPTVRRAWDDIVVLTGRANKRIAAMARDGVVRDVEGNTIILVFKASFHANSVSADPDALLEAIHEVLGGSWQLRCEVGGDQRGGGGGAAPRGGRTAAPAGGRTPSAAPRSAPPATPAPAAVEEWPATAPIGGQAPQRPAGGDAAPEAPRSQAAVRPSAVATVDDDFGPLDEPPYDPEFDGPTGRPAPVRVPAAAPAYAGAATSAAVRGAAVAPQRAMAAKESPGRSAAANAARNAAAARQRAAQAPVAGPAEPGFDPGDEPTDEIIDVAVAGQSIEEQAMDSLRQSFGHVEKIADI
ncbi:DNA polymerase III subunit gamma and tau [Hamadaea tsunoensis]|uniref:DNA polymerase III subunit gamma and tau n=1 Tax=Hamadaea tsunoensis TaxID=53368 RepID=UPI0003F89A86|nr:DNA polymerase III subunit gamma and tau [Hamadaea tsunoensis]